MAHIIFVKERFIFALVCNIVDAGQIVHCIKTTWFIEYEQVTAWVARFSFKLEANYHQPPSALDGSMGRRSSHRHYSLVNFTSPVGRNHWPSY
jgi:hypothetical protein